MSQSKSRALSHDQLRIALPKTLVVERELAKGGQGTVWTGQADGKAAAIKIYRADQIKKRIDREVAALRQLDCPHIARLLWADEIKVGAESYQVVATELVEGPSLDQLIAKGPLTEPQIEGVVRGIAKAIQSLWQHRIVHRDIKPDNIIAAHAGVKLIDLGVAKHQTESTLTATGFTLGTRGYMSPEQCTASTALTYRSDLYALAVVAIECALGKHPTDRDQDRLLGADFESKLPGKAKFLRKEALLRRMASKTPTKRPSIETILGALKEET